MFDAHDRIASDNARFRASYDDCLYSRYFDDRARRYEAPDRYPPYPEMKNYDDEREFSRLNDLMPPPISFHEKRTSRDDDDYGFNAMPWMNRDW
ncbi:MAG: hypothetical protein IPJ24_04030 [bacterium]|nr:hypothetical protein [bacterium]